MQNSLLRTRNCEWSEASKPPLACLLTSHSLTVVSVLQTALPSSLVQEFLTNSAEASSAIASEFAAGSIPSWFTGLPSDVQTYLFPSGAVATADATAITSGPSMPSAYSTESAYGTSTGSSQITSTSDSDSSSKTSASRTSSTASSSETYSAGASMPTAVMGVGLAGAVGFVGLLAL